MLHSYTAAILAIGFRTERKFVFYLKVSKKNLIWSGTSKVYFSLKNKIPFSAKGWHIFISMIAQLNTILTFIFLVHHFLSIINKKWFLWKPWRLDKAPRRGLCSCPVFMIFAYVLWGLLSVHCFSAAEMALNGCVIWIDSKTDSCSNKHAESCLRTETIFYDSLYCLQIIYKTFKSFWSVTISTSLNDVNSSSQHSVLFPHTVFSTTCWRKKKCMKYMQICTYIAPQCPHNLRGYCDLWPCSPNLKLNRKCQMIHTCPLLLAPCFHKLSWCSDNMDGGGDRDRAPPCCWASSRVS